MKLAAVVLVLLLGGAAHADPGRAQPGPRRQQLRALVMQTFDANHDGKLQPKERKQAARALKRLAIRMQRANGRQARRQKFIRRYDMNHDGNVGPGEMPPALANELRPLDADGDGWLRDNELP